MPSDNGPSVAARYPVIPTATPISIGAPPPAAAPPPEPELGTAGAHAHNKRLDDTIMRTKTECFTCTPHVGSIHTKQSAGIVAEHAADIAFGDAVVDQRVCYAAE